MTEEIDKLLGQLSVLTGEAIENKWSLENYREASEPLIACIREALEGKGEKPQELSLDQRVVFARVIVGVLQKIGEMTHIEDAIFVFELAAKMAFPHLNIRAR